MTVRSGGVATRRSVAAAIAISLSFVSGCSSRVTDERPAGDSAPAVPAASVAPAVAVVPESTPAPRSTESAASVVTPAPKAPATVAEGEQPEYQPGTNPWTAARARGANFRGIGQEPGWYVEMLPGKSIVAFLDYGERTVTAPWSAPQQSAGGRVTYRSRAAAGELVVVVTPVACADAMSGERMTHTVELRYGSSEYRGCGRALSEGWPAR